ncbi:MAG: spore maturation protein [Christensenellales bacterium]|jgi:spore maturation protein B
MQVINYASAVFVPLFIVGIVIYGMAKKVSVYESFIKGAKQGLTTVIRILPYVVGFVFAINIFTASGCFDYIASALSPVLAPIGIPPEILPLALIRPFSGSASIGVLTSLLQKYGPDSFIGRTASTLMGSSETLFYTTALYFGSVGIKKTRYTIPAALISELSGLIASVTFCRIFF